MFRIPMTADAHDFGVLLFQVISTFDAKVRGNLVQCGTGAQYRHIPQISVIAEGHAAVSAELGIFLVFLTAKTENRIVELHVEIAVIVL